MNKLSKKLLLIFITLAVVLSIACTYTQAATKVIVDQDKGTITTITTNADGKKTVKVQPLPEGNIGDNYLPIPWDEPATLEIINHGHKFYGGEYTIADLIAHGDFMCSQHGQPLPGEGSGDGEDATGTVDSMADIPEAGEKTTPIFTVTDPRRAKPEATFILAFAQHAAAETYGEQTPAQIAWWNIKEGQYGSGESLSAYGNEVISIGPGGTIADVVNSNRNNLNAMAKLFQKYICEVANITSAEFLKYDDDKFFDIKYNPTWVTEKRTYDGKEYDYANPTVVAPSDSEVVKCIAGPFAIDYVYYDSFAYMTKMEIETNDPEHKTLEYGKDWAISNVNKTNEKMPLPGEPFYLIFKNTYNATKIKNIHVEFNYLNGRGEYAYLIGEYKVSEVSYESEKVIDYYTDEDGDGEKETPHYKIQYKWEKTWGTKPAQTQTANIEAELRIFTETLDRNVRNDAQIEINKVLVDENGNVLEQIESDATFEFNIAVTGAVKAENDKLKVVADLEKSLDDAKKDGKSKKEIEDIEKQIVDAKKAIETEKETEKLTIQGAGNTTSQPYFWYSDEVNPTFTVEEANIPEGYELESIGLEGDANAAADDGTYTLRDGQTITIVVRNKIAPKTGSLKIKKIAEESPLGETTLINGKTFDFKATVSGRFSYKGEETKVQTIEIPVSVVADGEMHEVIPSGDIKWYLEELPEVTFDEINIPEGVEFVEFRRENVPSEENFNYEIVCVNRQLTETGKIKIIKTLEHAEHMSEEELENKEFNFKIRVQGHGEEEITIAAYTKVGNTYVWEYETEEYEWLAGQNPTYEIEEYNNPEGTEFSAERTREANSANSDITVDGNIVRGTLKAGENGTGVIENNIVNCVTAKHGKIELIKRVDEANLADKDYNFFVTVSGTFTYKGKEFRDKTIQLTTVAANTNGYNELENPEVYNNTELVVITAEAANKNESQKIEGQGTYLSDEFTWYGDAPSYKVEENLQGDDINHTVNPPEGKLSDVLDATPDRVVVTAWNGHERVGYIHIIKTLTGADKYPESQIKDLEFKFKIHVDNNEDFIVALKPQRVNNDWVWEYPNPTHPANQFSWRFDEEAPHYEVTEIEIPAGIEFDSATAPAGSTVDIAGKKISGVLVENKVTDAHLVATELNVTNKLSAPNKGTIKIDKKVTNGILNGKPFTFKVTIGEAGDHFTYGTEECNGPKEITGITVNGGSTWTSPEISWYGDPNKGPKYSVVEDDSNIAYVVSSENLTGYVKVASTSSNVATITNGPKEVGGYLQITKQVEGDVSADQEFTFKVTVGNDYVDTVHLKANETYKSREFKWKIAEGAPHYKVEEINIPDGVELKSISNPEGNLAEGSTVSVVAINKGTLEHKGQFKVTKAVVPNKFIDAAQKQKFDIKIKIDGTFIMNGQTHYKTDGAYEYVEELSVDISNSYSTTYTSPEIKWFGNDVPTITVEEINLPKGWKQVGSPSNNGTPLLEDRIVEIVVTNELPVIVEIDITLDLAGTVWEDNKNPLEDNMKYSVANGEIDGDESGVKGVEVYVYRVVFDGNGRELSRTLATAYADNQNAPLRFPIITSDDGAWEAPRVELIKLSEEELNSGAASAKYDVEFVYDGQTYEPTTFLAKAVKDSRGVITDYEEGNASEYISASTANRSEYAKKSMAKDFDREDVNNRVQSIYGKEPINGYGETTGMVSGETGNSLIHYNANVTEVEGKRVASNLQTTNSDGIAYDIFKAKSRTSVGGLCYPFDNKYHLQSYDVALTDIGLVQRYKYSATYDYCLHINLGLVRRPDVDLEMTKDLYSAKVAINGKLLEYRFNKLADFDTDVLNRNEVIDSQNITYELGLYKTDYYYRAEMYKGNSEVYNSVASFYKTLGKEIDDSELDVYLTYRINVYNSSAAYDAKVNAIEDYFDSTFNSPISENTYKMINNENVLVATNSYMKVGDSETKTPITWEVTQRNINGSDGITYNKMSANLPGQDGGVRLASGEKAEIYVTFSLRKTDVDGIRNAIELGNKSNIAEIANYTTLYRDGKMAGKIDKDSAPSNANIINYCDRKWFEDDTGVAPVLNVNLTDDSRRITGTVWEDSKDGNEGEKEDSEALIGGLTTELVEKVTVNGIDYDFLWPTNKPLACLGGKTLEEVTGGFSSVIETSSKDGKAGQYEFNNVPAGKYVVRFIYGNDKTQLENRSQVTLQDPVALKPDGTRFSDINTANYDNDIVNDELSGTATVYNGHDYKSTIYQKGYASVDSNGYISNVWHDLTNGNLANAKVSDARDSEARRLEVIANSQTITNVNGKVLATANDMTGNHTDLYNDYYMFADTAKIDLDIEDTTGLDGVSTQSTSGVIFENGSVRVAKEHAGYSVENIDLGLIERPENKIVLDKQISEIKLTTNDSKVIFDAIYDINYTRTNDINGKTVIAQINDNEYIVAEVTLNAASVGTDVMQALNKEEDKLTTTLNSGTQNFRFINVDETILQGTTVEINYLITALNVGETDYTSEALSNITETAQAGNKTVKEAIMDLANEISTAQASGTVELGKYLGKSYYRGHEANNGDVVVTTKVRQLVDYIDNDAMFATEFNKDPNHLWRNTTITELTGSGIEANRLIDQDVISTYGLVDSNGIAYITDQRNNLVLSMDSEENSELIRELVPFSENEDGYKAAITITTTRTVSSQSDADNLTFDNLAEIVKFENTVGRRDEATVTGNANPKNADGVFVESLRERDESATELVTFTPPQGQETEKLMLAQTLIVTTVALAIVAGGIVIIKKKVLTK